LAEISDKLGKQGVLILIESVTFAAEISGKK
jgi:hypothetical protein